MPNSKFIINRLHSGGVITTYYCSSMCRHCLYACSPAWEKEYIDKQTAEKVFRKIKELGCRSVHIGGGEPFLNTDGLKKVLETADLSGMRVEYVETNSSWYENSETAFGILSSLKKRGLSALLISISPFHNEYIPFYKVKGVMRACEDAGLTAIPWVPGFYSDIDGFDEKTPHSLAEYENRYGKGYLERVPSRYWIHLGGRALLTFSRIYGLRPLTDILGSEMNGCGELLEVGHFHFDLFGNYIPGLCSGLAMAHNDVGREFSAEKYPFLSVLFHKGVRGLMDFGAERFGFKPAEGYMSKCHLCYHIRRHIVLEKGYTGNELQPVGFYRNSLM